MRLLVTTQTVDRNDPYLGFFHDWLQALSPRFESVEVVCLTEGTHALPQNVRIHSLGKEKGGSRMAYIVHFFSHMQKLRGTYDAVFVHMNPEYLLLYGLFWKLSGKKIFLWYNHTKGGLRLMLAMLLADKVFHTSPHAASGGSSKSVRMPAGVDTELFRPPGKERAPFSVYLQGRVMPSKRAAAACEAVELLRGQDVPVTLTVVGPEDKEYVTTLRKRHARLVEEKAIVFLGSKSFHETPSLYASHSVALNLAASGNYDKTALEAMACETPLITAGYAFLGLMPKEWAGKDTPQKLADALLQFFALSEEAQRALGRKEREAVVANESLPALIDRLDKALKA
jgi:glycosyltransferase involved in cell wall biosynthesis